MLKHNGADTRSDLRIDLVVVGAHLSGMPLNHELVALDAEFASAASTAAEYRLFELDGVAPRKPGLLRVGPANGRRIDVEIWRLSPAAFGLFVSRLPPPLCIGTVQLSDGRAVKGFLVESVAVEGARDVSEFCGWRAYCASLATG
jgi:allophanate hydrolase